MGNSFEPKFCLPISTKFPMPKSIDVSPFVIDVFLTTCPSCRVSFPMLRKQAMMYKNLYFACISPELAEVVEPYIKKISSQIMSELNIFVDKTDWLVDFMEKNNITKLPFAMILFKDKILYMGHPTSQDFIEKLEILNEHIESLINKK